MDQHLSVAPHISRHTTNGSALAVQVSEAISVAKPQGCWAGPNPVLLNERGAARAPKNLPPQALQQTGRLWGDRASCCQAAARLLSWVVIPSSRATTVRHHRKKSSFPIIFRQLPIG
jgi:hypothetical protein